MRRVIIGPQAEDDLEEIEHYIAGDSPQRAVTFALELREQMQRLAHVGGGHSFHEDVGPPLRRMIHGNYLIFYEVVGDEEIHVFGVAHGARDLAAWLNRRASRP